MSPHSPRRSPAGPSSSRTAHLAPATALLNMTHSAGVLLRTTGLEVERHQQQQQQAHQHQTQQQRPSSEQVTSQFQNSPTTSLNGRALDGSISASSLAGFSPAEGSNAIPGQTIRFLEKVNGSPKVSAHGGGSSSSQSKREGGPDEGEEGDQKLDKGDKRTPQRARTGCLTCRRRKVKCDEARPRCARCKIKLRECVWPGEGPYSLSKRKSSSTYPEHSPQNTFDASQSNRTFGSFSDLGAANTGLPNFALHDANLDHLSFNFPIDPFASQPTGTTLNPNVISQPFDPSSYLDLLPILPQPQSSRFYVPPDFLPKTTQPDAFRGFRSNEFVDSLMAPRKKAEMMADPVFLRPYFPTIAERLVMRHYLLETVHVVMAFECPRRPWNPWIEIHAPLAFNHPPGTSPAADALRAAILAVGAVHMRFRADPNDQAGAWNVVRVAKAKVLGLVRQRIEAQEATNTPLDKDDVELILAALLSCTIASSLAADDSWQELLTSVLALVDRLGGASMLIREGTHEHLSSFRFMLEQLAIRDVFGCMTTQMSPSILNVAFSPWFFEAEGWSNRDDEWESVERMFGFSRGMVDVIARCCTLISKMRKNGQTLLLPPNQNKKHKSINAPHSHPHQPASSNTSNGTSISSTSLKPPTSPSSFSLRLPPRALARSSRNADTIPSHSHETTPAPSEPPAIDTQLYAEAEGLMAELGVWDNVSSLTPFHARTMYGNHSYRHAIKIRLLREVFGVEREDPRVQSSCASIVELGVESLSLFGRITWLTWPIVISAFNLTPGDPLRLTALSLLGEFGQYACFDNGAACRVMAEFYSHEEMIGGCMTPAEVGAKMRFRPFLD